MTAEAAETVGPARRGGWTPRLLVLALAVQAALPAPAAAAALAASPAAQPRPRPRGTRSGLQERVATLTRALGLDARQQAALRTLLLEQRQQVQHIWSDQALSGADRVAASRSVSTRTADRIRALLSEEQRKKFDPPPRADPGRAAGGTRVEDWMNAEGKP